MAEFPERLQPGGKFPEEWNKINDFFHHLVENFFKSDGSIIFEISPDAIVMRARYPVGTRFVEATEDIANEDEGEVSKLRFNFSTDKYDLLDPEFKFKARTDLSGPVNSGDKFEVFLLGDGIWQARVVSAKEIITGNINAAMRKGDKVDMSIDTGGNQDVEDLKDLIPSINELNTGAGIIATRGTPGLLITWSCDDLIVF